VDVRRLALPVLLLLCSVPPSLAVARQGGGGAPARRVTTIDALHRFPGFYHLQNVLLRGEFAEDGAQIALRADGQEMRAILADGARTVTGPAEIRGQVIDVGRLAPGDPRATPITEERGTERWPSPGEELFVRVTDAVSAAPPIAVTVRALALEPWRYDGETVTVTGNFRGRNLFGDLPGAPATSRYDFVVRGSEGAIWVTGLRPRGRGFDLDIDRRVDTDEWLDVTGTIVHERGLVRIEATQLATARAQTLEVAEEVTVPPPPPPPLDVVFAVPTDGEIDVAAASPVRVQFSRGLDPKSVAGSIRVSYPGAGPGVAPPPFQITYDAANRAITIRFEQPLERFRTVRVEILETLKAFDGGAARPWMLTFTVG
jgi:hypothetical protein